MLGAHRYYPELIDCDLCGAEAPTGGLKGDARLDWLRFKGWAIFLITWPVGNPVAGGDGMALVAYALCLIGMGLASIVIDNSEPVCYGG